MAIDRMQTQRFELKYLLHEETALQVRDFVQCYLPIDEYGVGRPNLSYNVHSLYLDSDALTTYWDTINGNRNRYKLRIRFYSTDPSVPVYFEIKRRANSCIMKQRGGVKGTAMPLLLSGYLPEADHLVSYTPKALTALNNFSRLMNQIQAKPKVHIAYQREAYANEPGTVRVTLDRHVCSQANLDGKVDTKMKHPHHSFLLPEYAATDIGALTRQCTTDYLNDPPPPCYVILELKFNDRFPLWFRDLVRHFNLMQRGAAKYCASIQAIGGKALGSVFPIVEEEEVQHTE